MERSTMMKKTKVQIHVHTLHKNYKIQQLSTSRKHVVFTLLFASLSRPFSSAFSITSLTCSMNDSRSLSRMNSLWTWAHTRQHKNRRLQAGFVRDSDVCVQYVRGQGQCQCFMLSMPACGRFWGVILPHVGTGRQLSPWKYKDKSTTITCTSVDDKEQIAHILTCESYSSLKQSMQ